MWLAAVWLGALLMAQSLWAQETKEKVTVDDVDRSFTVRLPKGYDAQTHYPVVILLHGMNQDADDMQRLTRFDELADKDGIIAVYPSAMHGRWNVGVRPQAAAARWAWGRADVDATAAEDTPAVVIREGAAAIREEAEATLQVADSRIPSRQPSQERRAAEADDVAFINQMLDQTGNQVLSRFVPHLCRRLVRGRLHEPSARMRLGDRIAAVAAVGAAMPKTMICLPSRPVPLVMINGTSDPVVPYGGGTEHNRNLRTVSVEDSAKAWAKIDRCDEKPEKTKLPAHEKGGMETKVDTYNGCHENAQVVSLQREGSREYVAGWRTV